MSSQQFVVSKEPCKKDIGTWEARFGCLTQFQSYVNSNLVKIRGVPLPLNCKCTLDLVVVFIATLVPCVHNFLFIFLLTSILQLNKLMLSEFFDVVLIAICRSYQVSTHLLARSSCLTFSAFVVDWKILVGQLVCTHLGLGFSDTIPFAAHSTSLPPSLILMATTSAV